MLHFPLLSMPRMYENTTLVTAYWRSNII